jgi:class 3 adenylate cyclase
MVENQRNEAEREVTIMLTDIVGYSRRTSAMTPDKVRDFVVEYHKSLHAIINKKEYEPIEIEPSAGDGALIIFGKRPGEDSKPMCQRALAAATEMAFAINNKKIVATRMGLFMGDIIEAHIGNKTAKFGTVFAIASRLEALCDYFGTSLLMDRDVAANQDEMKKHLVLVGKVTPQNINHPVHLHSVYMPGVHSIPDGVDSGELSEFISLKNEAMELFCGNELLSIEPDFPQVRQILSRAKEIYQSLCGTVDIATERILEYIRETPYPRSDFKRMGMKIYGYKNDPLGVRLLHLSKEFLKAIDKEFYEALVVDTGWENYFTLEWHRKGDVVVSVNDVADGIYYIDSGTVVTMDEQENVIATLGSGSIFGEMAYFSRQRKRNATVVTASDVVLRKISTQDFEKLPVIQKIFKRIASQRKTEIPVPS